MKLSIGYPSAEDEHEILRRRRQRKSDAFDLQAVIDAQGLLEMRQAVEEVYIEADIERYIVSLIARTRQHHQIAVGASPRATLALLKLARAWAAVQGRAYVIPDDVKLFLLPVLSHRLILEPDLWTVHKAAEDLIIEIQRSVPVPVLRMMK
jgi:MoxR-like ATPase